MISASGSSLLALIAHASKGAIETSTGMSLLLAIFHASFDAAINQLADHVTHGPNTPRFLIFSAAIVHLQSPSSPPPEANSGDPELLRHKAGPVTDDQSTIAAFLLVERPLLQHGLPGRKSNLNPSDPKVRRGLGGLCQKVEKGGLHESPGAQGDASCTKNHAILKRFVTTM